MENFLEQLHFSLNTPIEQYEQRNQTVFGHPSTENEIEVEDYDD